MLIDHSFFTHGIIEIPNLNAEDINWYIERYEQGFLQRLLGDTLYKEYIDGIAQPTPDAKWKALEDKLKENPSPIAHFVFIKFYTQKVSLNTGIGEVVPNAENASYTTSNHRVSEVWNEMVDMIYGFYDWLIDTGDYPTGLPDGSLLLHDNPVF